MIQMRFLFHRPIYALCLAAGLATVAAASGAQTKPLTIRGAGVVPEGLPLPGQAPRFHWAVGEATHLGRYYSEGAVDTLSAEFDPGGHITGTFAGGAGDSATYFEAANGDRLVMQTSGPGLFDLTILGVTGDGALLVQGGFTASFVVLPARCTGRFAGATGSWLMHAFTEPFVLGSDLPVAFVWSGSGSLTIPKK